MAMMLGGVASLLLVGGVWIGSPPEIQLEYKNFSGLKVSLSGVPVVTGSSFQYYEKGWSKGYYSSAWKPVDVKRLGDGRIQIDYSGSNGEAVGTHIITERIDGFDIDYQFVWRGDKPVRLESSFARLWAPFFESGTVKMGNTEIGPLNRPARAGLERDMRFLTTGTQIVEFSAPSAMVRIESDRPIQLMDARNYSVEWAQDQELFWLGATEIDIAPQESIRFRQKWTIEPKATSEQPSVSPGYRFYEESAVVRPNRKVLPIIPKPQQINTSGGNLKVGKNWKFLGERNEAEIERSFEGLLDKWWDLRSVSELETRISYRIGSLGLKAEGYRIDVSSQGVEIVGQDLAGIRHAFQTLAQMVQVRGGELTLPIGSVVDYPALNWRGVHMFVGPSALTFQSKLMDQLLGPMKLNKVVLQCERASWETIKGTETAITMPKSDLIALSNRYKSKGFEVLPLIQSLGHCGWLFENKQNLDIAINPDVPFTLDPRKAKARELLQNLWKEVDAAIEPSTVHFGMDEVDMRGMKVDPSFTDRLISQHMPFLNQISKDLGVKPMIWGDMMLHPSEAIDAANAPSLEAAKKRRSTLAPGTFIADWHYKDDPEANNYKSLKLWKSAGMKPIASGWYRPKNILGNVSAAKAIGGGYLQTTWAGYESSEANMVKGFQQFAAYVLAGEYAWSGRTTTPDNLGYDPGEALRQMYFAPKKVVKVMPGKVFGQGKPFAIGEYQFREMGALQLRGVTTKSAFSSPDRLVLAVGYKLNRIVIAADVLARVSETERVGKILVKTSDGKTLEYGIDYGVHLRSANDKRASVVSSSQNGRSALLIELDAESFVQEIVIERVGMSAGLRVFGVSTF